MCVYAWRFVCQGLVRTLHYMSDKFLKTPTHDGVGVVPFTAHATTASLRPMRPSRLAAGALRALCTVVDAEPDKPSLHHQAACRFLLALYVVRQLVSIRRPLGRPIHATRLACSRRVGGSKPRCADGLAGLGVLQDHSI